MPIFGGVKSLTLRPQVRLEPLDFELLHALEAAALPVEALLLREGRAMFTLLAVRQSVERLRMRGLIKQLPHGKWVAQDAQKGVAYVDDNVAAGNRTKRRRAA